jgi:REP element-mobilizing transposase RayT
MIKPESVREKKSLRLEGYDYSVRGPYFITLTTSDHRHLFGDISECKIDLSVYGRIAHCEWFNSIKYRKEINLNEDEFVVMPNHVHGIVWIVHPINQLNTNELANHSGVWATGRLPVHKPERNVTGPRPKSLSSFVAGYKSAVTKKINKLRRTPGKSVWLRNYHDRVIRNERELHTIRVYIQNNPMKWELDRYFAQG